MGRGKKNKGFEAGRMAQNEPVRVVYAGNLHGSGVGEKGSGRKSGKKKWSKSKKQGALWCR